MHGMDGSPVPVPERGGPPLPLFPTRSVLLGASAGRQGKDLEVCSMQPGAAWGDGVGGGGVLQSTRGTPGCFPMGSGVLCVDRGGEMVLSSPASALPHL